MKLELEIKQSLKLAPAMVQLIELVQMSAQELDDYIMQEALDNPLLDLEQLSRREQNAGAYERARWLQSQRQWEASPLTQQEDAPSQEPEDERRNTLSNALLVQLAAAHVSSVQRGIGRYLIGCVDERGYLNEDPAQVARRFNVTQEEAEACFALLRSFSPPGVCARDLPHCLLMQLPPEDTLAAAIVDGYLDDLAQGHCSQIARALSVSTAEVRQAGSRISALSPRPSSGFVGSKDVQYLVPDILVEERNGELEVSLYRSYMPDLRINNTYLDMYRKTDDEQRRHYLNERMQAAEQLCRCVNQRESSILSCAKEIVAAQRDYFLGRDNTLRPLGLGDIADSLGVSVSTVSRTIKNKYLQCNRGVLPLKHFPQSVSRFRDLRICRQCAAVHPAAGGDGG